MTQDHFAWAMDETVYPTADGQLPSFDGLLQPPGNVESIEVLSWLKRTASTVPLTIGIGIWLIVEGNEAVGIISFKSLPENGAVELGYSVTESRRGRGHATRAVALVIAEANALGLDLTAETADDNRASKAVLVKNGFVECGERIDDDDGPVILWRRGAS